MSTVYYVVSHVDSLVLCQSHVLIRRCLTRMAVAGNKVLAPATTNQGAAYTGIHTKILLDSRMVTRFWHRQQRARSHAMASRHTQA